jgi:uncharacterized protein YciI
MLVTIICIDKPGHLELRMKTRPAHVKWGETVKLKDVAFTGPILADDGASMMGSILIADFPDLDAARAFHKNDPYVAVGLFERVIIQPTRSVILPK